MLDAVIVLGIVLRLFQYFASVSVWLDEASLALDVRESSLFELLRQPLDRLQVAPKGFLLVQGIIFKVAGDGEYALRFFPLICSLIGLLLFRRLALRALEPGLAILATLGFVLASPLIRYAAEGKPYGIDATAAILLSLVALHIRERVRSPLHLAGVALASGCIAWFSAFATFVLAGLGISLVLRALWERDRRALRDAILVSAIWGVVALAVTVVSLKSMTPGTRDFMHQFWQGHMLPSPLNWGTALGWLGSSLGEFFAYTWSDRWSGVLLMSCALGFLAFWQRRSSVALMLAMPIAIAIGAAIGRQYPLYQRLMLGTLPAICLFLSAGIGWLADRAVMVAKRAQLKSAHMVRPLMIAASAMLVMGAFARRLPPYRVQEMKPLLAYIREHQMPGDGIISHYTASAALDYYAPSYGFKQFTASHWPATTDDSVTIPGLDSLGGKQRVWLIFVRDVEFLKRREAIFNYLNRTGGAIDSLVVRWPVKADINSEVYLYDFTVQR